MTEPFVCVRCGRDDQGRIGRIPFPNELGERIVAEICAPCWEEWKERQMLLINHYGLKLHESAAREFLYTNLRIYLFGEEGTAASIDASEEGSVEW